MIKIFGKIRYHWQPELSWSIIYWSIAFMSVFIGLALLRESSSFSGISLTLFVLFVLMALIGIHRYFVIEEEKLYIAAANPFATKKIPISSIEKVSVTYLNICILTKDRPKGLVFHMRKWPKKYFINALALNPHFKGEVELTDHLITQDYFEEYYAPKE